MASFGCCLLRLDVIADWQLGPQIAHHFSLAFVPFLILCHSRITSPRALISCVRAGPAKLLVGTEQGAVMALNMRKRAAATTTTATSSSTTATSSGGKGGAAGAAAAAAASSTNVVDPSVIAVMDLGAGRHHGPITSIQRNPFYPSAYMTVGDWGVRLWHEKNKNPILMTPYSKAFLTNGACLCLPIYRFPFLPFTASTSFCQY